jgi:hypothetical protein
MYILTSKYFPTDYWPDDYFPALPEGADIQYTEVMEFAVVLPNDEVADAMAGIIVAGAGTTDFNGFKNGKPYYEFGNCLIEWQSIGTLSPYWSIRYTTDQYDIPRYLDFEDVATPDLCTAWDINYGASPVPTVTKSFATTLTEVATFTLEMPMAVELEVYEELSL